MRRCELIVHVTPVQRRLLRDHAWALADAACEDIEGRGELAVADGDWRIFHRLPPCTFRQDVEWRRRFARSFVYLAEDLEAGVSPVPRTMCEQIALLLIVEDASSATGIGEVDPDVIAVPASSRDRDWTASLRSLANELAVARLHDPHLAPTWLRILPMERWFDTDEPGTARDPQRGVHR